MQTRVKGRGLSKVWTDLTVSPAGTDWSMPRSWMVSVRDLASPASSKVMVLSQLLRSTRSHGVETSSTAVLLFVRLRSGGTATELCDASRLNVTYPSA